MSEQIWTIKTNISGSFFLAKDERIKSGTPPHPLVRRFHIRPDFDENDNQVGTFDINIDFSVDGSESEKVDSYIIADLARDIFDYYINLITFLTSSEVKKEKPLEIKYEYPEGGKYRIITVDNETVNLIPPVPLSHTHLLASPMDAKFSRCLAFYAYGIREKDLLTSTYFLLSALELVAAQIKIDKKRTRKCENCGHEKQIEAGTADKVKHILTSIPGVSTDDSKEIWKIRNSIFHGYFDISSKNIRDITDKRRIIRIAIIKSIKDMIGLNKNDLPYEKDNNWFSDPIMDIEYETNE